MFLKVQCTFFLFEIYSKLCVFVCCVTTYTGTPRDQGRGLDALELGLQAIVSHLVWVLGIKLGSFGRAVSAVNHWTLYPMSFIFRKDKKVKDIFY